MSDAQPERHKRHRSPNYPSVSLPEAAKRIKKLYDEDHRAGSSINSAVQHLGFNRPHGTAMTFVSALRKYGLVEVSNDRLTLTDRAVAISVYPEDDQRRIDAIRAAALAPEIYKELFDRFSASGSTLPSEQTLKAELQAEMNFNPKAVIDFVADFKATLLYAGLLEDDGVTLRPLGAKVGDYVQWEPNGVLQFSEPKRVREISADGKFAFVDGSDTGLPMTELSQAKAPQSHAASFPDPKTLFRSVADSISGVPTAKQSFNAWTLAPGVTAELRINGQMSPEDLDMLRDYVEITIKALRRTSAKSEKE